MGIGVSLILIAVGAILAFAVSATVSGVDVTTIGWILMVVGLAGPEPQDGKPVGTVFVAVHGPSTGASDAAGGGKVTALRLNGDRAEIRMESVRSVLALLLEELADEQPGNERAQDTERNGGF